MEFRYAGVRAVRTIQVEYAITSVTVWYHRCSALAAAEGLVFEPPPSGWNYTTRERACIPTGGDIAGIGSFQRKR